MRDMTPLPTLKALIGDVQSSNDWSDVDVAQRAKSAGHNLTTKDISLWRTGGMALVNPDKMRALAYGLSVPAYRVILAVMADFEIEFPIDVSTPERAIEHDVTLNARIKETLLLLLQRERSSSGPRGRG